MKSSRQTMLGLGREIHDNFELYDKLDIQDQGQIHHLYNKNHYLTFVWI